MSKPESKPKSKLITKPVAVKVDRLNIGYNANSRFNPLIKDISFEIEKGQLVAIIGSNGTGKSTLLKTLSNEIKYEGSVKLFSEEVKSINPKNFAHTLSSVGTTYQVQSYTTVEEVIAKGRSVHTDWLGRFDANDKKTVLESAQKVGVDHLLERFYNTLSDGEKQRTLIAMSLAQQSRIILLDEPTAFIDYPNKYFLTALLKDITEKEQKTVLFSSHDLEVVLSYADKILLFSEQQVELLNIEDVLKEEQLLKLFDKHRLSDDFKLNLVHQLLKTYSR